MEGPTTVLSDIRDLIAKCQRKGLSLVVVAGQTDMIGRSFRLEKPETVIGRSSEADIVVQGEGVSRRHCRIVMEAEDKARVEDLGSTNGTLVNGNLIVIADLCDGDKIQVGQAVVFKVVHYDSVDEEMFSYLYDAATRDPLTRAYNKKYLMESLRRAVAYARRNGRPLSIILLDIDRFKGINDRYGHVAGDMVLKRLAETVLSMCHTEDIFARFGGEEFVLVATGCGAREAYLLAERVRRKVEETAFDFQGERIPVTVSAGFATTDGVALADVESLLAEADRHLYRAKDGGRNRVEPSLADDLQMSP